MQLLSGTSMLLVAGTLAIVIASVESYRIGCFIDRGSGRDLPFVVHSGGWTNRQNCLNYCKARGFRYFGLQAGDWCFCGNSYGRYGRARDSDCSTRCWGNRAQTCGGGWRNEIFTTNIQSTDGIRLGCYVDRGSGRDMPIALRAKGRTTKEFCVNFCRSRGYRYAGLQAGDWCNCGNSYGRYGRASDSQCRSSCHGDRSRTCGGGWRNEVFTTGASGSRRLTNRVGCYVDRSSRDLSLSYHSGRPTERNFCINYCKSRGYKYAGMQAGDWCTCGNSYGRYGRAQDVDCYSQCWGDPSQTCGGAWRNEIFRTGIRESDGIRMGCYIDRGSRRDLTIALRANQNKKSFCVNFCRSRGYKYAGLQAGDWCFCGNSYGRYGKASESQCNSPCFGDRSQKCGGGYRNEVFTTGSRGVRTLTNRIGCYVDRASRDMSFSFHSLKRTNRNFCINYCKSRGYKYAGLQAGDWCNCGNSYGRYGKANDADCYRQCWGGPNQTCGGEWRNEIFETGITTSDGIRLGCFKDKSKRDLPLSFKAGTRTTKQYCVNFCKSRSYQYASLQAGDWCHCGNSYGRYGRVKDSECRRKCWGDRSQTCGGDWRNEIFTTGVIVYKYVGCFKDESKQPDLDLHAGTSSDMRLGKCRSLCKRAGSRYMYFTVRDGRRCFCGEQYGAYGTAEAKRCNVRCRGNSRQTCGGSGVNSVYSVN